MEMEPDIDNMMMSKYLEYEAAKERRLWDDVRSRISPTHYDKADFSSSRQNKSNTFYYPIRDENLKRMEQDIDQDSICEQDDDLEEDREEDGDDRDIFDMWDITVEDYVAPATKSILDDLLEEFRDEILNVTMVDEGADCSLTKDLEELKILLAKDPQSHYTKIRVHSVIIDPKPFIHTHLTSLLYGMFKTSKPCKVDRDIISPGRYDFYSSFPYPVAYLHPNGVYCYFHPHLIPSERMDTLLPSK
ncbi:hypothetical protein Tco_0461327 [Tanacetum coccineum]